MRATVALWLVFSVGCASDRFLPAGSDVPALADDAARAARLLEDDGVPDRVWLTNGFSLGEPVSYWDLGPVEARVAMPVYVLCRPSGSACAPIDHPRIAEALPGSAGYSPFGWIWEVATTDRYAGQVIPSAEALADAQRAGLVEAPEATIHFIELSLVHPSVQIELGPDTWASPNATVYAEGVAVPAIDFEPTHGRLRLDDSEGHLSTRNVYSLTREGESLPIHERPRMTDLTGDGDLSDSNNILGTRLGEADYTPAWHVVRVTVPADYASIDTAHDQSSAAYRAATDMFTIAPDYTLTPVPGAVVAHTVEDLWVDCPVQSAPGAL